MIVAILGHRLADDDRFPRDRRWLTSGGVVIPAARLAGAKIGVLPSGDLVQMLADGLGVGRAGAGRTSLSKAVVMPKEISEAQRVSR
jgi:hypothetical protein